MEAEISPEDLYFPYSFQGDSLPAKLKFAYELLHSRDSQLTSCRNELRRSEELVKKLQAAAVLQSHNHNNTSSAFTLPSEFLQIWENFQEEIMDTFEEFLQKHWLVAWLVRDITEVVYDTVKIDLETRLGKLTKIFMLEDNQKEHVKKTFLRVFQDNCGRIMQLTPENCTEINEKFLRKAKVYLQASELCTLESLFGRKTWTSFLAYWLKLCLHMVYSEPQITLAHPPALEYRNSAVTKAEDLYVIDGFADENPVYVVILPPPTRNGSPYPGLKPAVLFLPAGQSELTTSDQQRLQTDFYESDDEGRTSHRTVVLHEEPESPVIHSSYRYAKAASQQQLNQVTRSTQQMEASPKEVMALYQHFKSLKNYGSQPSDSYLRRSRPEHIKPLVLQEPGFAQDSSRQSMDDTPCATSRLRRDCPDCKAQLPCTRCYRQTRPCSSSLMEEKEDRSKTTLMKKRLETAKRTMLRQNTALRPKEPCKVM